MRRFRFRLEQVLRVRRVQEDRARYELLSANREVHTAEARVAARLDEYATREMPRGPHSHAEFVRDVFLLESAAGAVDVAKVARRLAVEAADERRGEWTVARRRVEALTRLETRRRAEHALEAQRADDRLVDDLVVARHTRREARS